MINLLGSKNVWDVLETIKLLTLLKEYNIISTDEGMRRMLILIFSEEKSIKDEVILTFKKIYMD